MMEDFGQIILSGLGGGLGGFGEEMKYQNRRKDKVDDAIKIAEAKQGNSINEILQSVLGGAAKQAIKDGRTVDLSGIKGIDPTLQRLLQGFFGRGAAPAGGGVTTTKPSLFGTPSASTGGTGYTDASGRVR